MRGSIALLSLLLVTAPIAMGCVADSADADEADATANATTVVKSLEGPGGLAVVGDQLVYSTAHFVASGDPELDQQFAYWTGELNVRPLDGGKKTKLGDTAGAVWNVLVRQGSILVLDSGYNGITKYAMPSGKESDFYNDYSHFGDEGESQTLGGVAAEGGEVFVTRAGSEVMRMQSDGSKVETFAKTWKKGWVEEAEEIVALKDAVYWSTQQQGEQGSTYNLYRATRTGTTHTPKKLATYKGRVSSLATDGTSVYVAVAPGNGQEVGEIDVVTGTDAPRALVADQPGADHLVVDELGLFFADYGKGYVGLVPTAKLASTSPVTPVKVLKVKRPSSLALSKEHLYVASDSANPNEKTGSILRLARTKIKAE